MTKDQILAELAQWKGRKSLPANIIKGNGWTPEQVAKQTCAAKRDGQWVRVPFVEWQAEHEAEADAHIKRLTEMMENA